MAGDSIGPGADAGHALPLLGSARSEDDLDAPSDASGFDRDSEFSVLLAELAATPEMEVPRHGAMLRTSRIGERYRVERKLGQGGMGVVYLATDERLGRPVAIKLCFDAARRGGSARIAQEARALAALSHPNVLEIYGVGRHRGALYIAMEYVEGGTADAWVRASPPRSWREIVAFYCGAGEGLAAAHRQGVVHRDFKPENILVGHDGVARVADFGLARTSEKEDSQHGRPTADETESNGDARLTRRGSVVGTPAYMAPEQLFGLEVDARADQFSFCCSLFEALFARRPFSARSGQARLHQMSVAEVRMPMDRRGVPRWVARVVLRGLRFSADDRFPSMQALLDALRAGPRRRRWIAGTTAMAAVFGVIALPPSIEPLCSTDGALGELWNDQARAEIEARFASTAAGEGLFPRVSAEIDQYTAAWNDAYAGTCEATDRTTATSFDEAMSCLVRLRSGLRVTLALLRDADETTISHGLELIGSMEPADVCRGGEPGPPGGPLRGVEMLLEDQIAQARAHFMAGRWITAEQLSTAVLARARVLASRSLLADALLLRAEVEVDAGRTPEGIVLLEEAYFVGLDAGNQRATARSALALLDAHGRSSREDFAKALHWYAVARAAAERVGPDILDPLEVQASYGFLLIAADERETAFEELRAVETVLDARGEEVSKLRVRVEIALAALKQGVEDTVAEYENILTMSVELWGPDHPRSASAREWLAVSYSHVGNDERAAELLSEARDGYERAFGPNNNRLVSVYNKLAGLQSRAGDVDEAITTYHRALDLSEAAAEPSTRELVGITSNLGSAYLAASRPAQAVEYLSRAVTISEASMGADASRTGMALVNLAGAYLAAENYAQAEPLLVRALAILEATMAPGHRGFVVASLNLAMVQQHQGRFEEATSTLAQAQEHARSNPNDLGEIAEVEGSLRRENDDSLGAIESYTRCAEIYAELYGEDDQRRVRCLSSVAGLAMERGAVAQARPLLEDLLVRVTAVDAPVRPSTFANVHFHLARAVRSSDPARARALLRAGLSVAYAGAPPAVRETFAEMTALLEELEEP